MLFREKKLEVWMKGQVVAFPYLELVRTLTHVLCIWTVCNRTFVENRKYVEMLVAVDTPWQGDFWRQEGLTDLM